MSIFINLKNKLTIHELLRFNAQLRPIPDMLPQFIAGTNMSKLRKIVQYFSRDGTLPAARLAKDEKRMAAALW